MSKPESLSLRIGRALGRLPAVVWIAVSLVGCALIIVGAYEYASIPPAPVATVSSHPTTSDTPTTFLILWVLAGLFYFLPWLVAAKRGVVASGGVLVVNLFFGWTVLGWLIALIWAASGETKADVKAKQIDYAQLAAAIAAQQNKPPGS